MRFSIKLNICNSMNVLIFLQKDEGCSWKENKRDLQIKEYKKTGQNVCIRE